MLVWWIKRYFLYRKKRKIKQKLEQMAKDVENLSQEELEKKYGNPRRTWAILYGKWLEIKKKEKEL